MRRQPLIGLAMLLVAAASAFGVWTLVGLESRKPLAKKSTAVPLAELKRHLGTVVRTPSAPLIDSGLKDFHGRPVKLRCATCHEGRAPRLERCRGDELTQFHQGLHTAHGSLTCVSCHAPPQYESLRLADGRRIPFAESMTLCAQCHGPQKRDYDHGAHGGMKGYWDLARGGRLRNHCIDCHDPHAPKYPQTMPAFPPVDRFPIAGTERDLREAAPGEDRHGRR